MGRRLRNRGALRTFGGFVSLGLHAAVLVALFWPRPIPPDPVEPPPLTLALTPPEPAPQPAPAPPAPEKQPAPVAARQPTPPRPVVVHHVAARKPAPVARPTADAPSEEVVAEGPPAELTDAQLAGAASADSGGGGGGGACNMARRVQAALRKDPMVRAAVAQSGASRALLVWNGDWVQSRGESGKGLSAVREAIAWEVGFSPRACREEPVHGFILFSLGEAPGSMKLALGSGAWRWSDLLK